MGEGDGSRATGCDWMDYVGISEGAAGVCEREMFIKVTWDVC